MRARNGVVPPGMGGFLVIAAAIIPALIDNAKPLARRLANGLIKAGEKLREAATEGSEPPTGKTSRPRDPVAKNSSSQTKRPGGSASTGTEPQSGKPNSSMADKETTKRGKKAGGVDVITASSAGHEELEAAAGAEIKT